MIESTSDLLAFCDPSEFGDRALITIDGVPLPISGIADTYADEQTPGGNNNSGRGSFTVGAAVVAVQTLQFTTTYPVAAAAKPEDQLEILEGDYVGLYRVNRVARDGGITRLMLNKKS